MTSLTLPPDQGSWLQGHRLTDPVTGEEWICVKAGAPGSWVKIDSTSLLIGVPGPAVLQTPTPGEYATPNRGATSTGAPSVGLCFWTWLPLAKGATIDRIGVEVTATAVNATERLGIRLDNGNGRPGALLLDVGTTFGLLDTHTATGLVEATISQALPAPGVWLGAVAQTAAATLRTCAADQHLAGFSRTGGTVVTQFDLSAWSETGVTGAFPAGAPTVIGDAAPSIVVVRFA